VAMWEIIIGSIGGSAVLFGAMAWLIKCVVIHYLSKDIEEHKVRLKSESEKELLELKSTLERFLFEHQVRFSKLHARQAEKITEIHEKIYELQWAAADFLRNYPGSDNKERQRYLGIVDKKADEFQEYYLKNSIFFSEKICQQINNFIDYIYLSYIPLRIPVETGIESEESGLEEWRKATDVLKKEIHDITISLKEKFREILGVIESDQKELAKKNRPEGL
jgi:hypothetical protein